MDRPESSTLKAGAGVQINGAAQNEIKHRIFATHQYSTLHLLYLPSIPHRRIQAALNSVCPPSLRNPVS